MEDLNEYENEKTFYFQWHFLERCNLRCVHCYQDNYTVRELPEDQIFYIAKHLDKVLKKWKRKGRISLTGGEPFLNTKLLFKLLEFFEQSRQFYWVGILTNGTLIDHKIAQKLASFSKLHEVQVSLDGATEHVHDLIRGTGNYKKAISSIKILKEYGIYTSIMFTLMRWNLQDVDRIIDLAIKLQVDALTIERITPTNEFAMKNLSLTKEEVFLAYTRVYERKKQLENGHYSLKIRTSRPLWNILNKEMGGFCPVGISSLSILHDGTVLPCRRLPIPIGNIFRDGLFKIWYTSDLLWHMRLKDNINKDCKNCPYLPYCGGCRAIAYAVTGDPFSKDPHCFLGLFKKMQNRKLIKPIILKKEG